MTEGGLLIVNADDLGYDDHHTDAILQCARRGQISSATAMMFMQGSDRAAAASADAGLGIGLHLNLSEAFSTADVPAEVRDTQTRLLRRFDATVARRVHRWIYDPTIQNDVDRSIAHQLDRFRALYGREPTHVDGHQHVHLCPNVFLSRVIPASTKWRRSLDLRGGTHSPAAVARALRQRLMARRPCTRWFFDIAEVDPRADRGRAAELLGRSERQAVEVMAHPGFAHERERLDAPEWAGALQCRPVGSYADLPARPVRG